MPANPVLAAFTRLKVWETNGDRAPHKPLLVFLALGRWMAGTRYLDGPYTKLAGSHPQRTLHATLASAVDAVRTGENP
jgi:hypothetical protein